MTQDHRLGARFLMRPGSVSPLSLQSSQEDIIEVLARGPDYTTYGVRVQVHQADNTVQYLSEVRAGLQGLYTHNPNTTWQCPEPTLKPEDPPEDAPRTLPRVSHSPMTKESGLPRLLPATREGRKTLPTYL